MTIALEQYEKRIDWLSRGSRELFGTVIENNICILIDTSHSMQSSLDFVKKKLSILIQVSLTGQLGRSSFGALQLVVALFVETRNN